MRYKRVKWGCGWGWRAGKTNKPVRAASGAKAQRQRRKVMEVCNKAELSCKQLWFQIYVLNQKISGRSNLKSSFKSLKVHKLYSFTIFIFHPRESKEQTNKKKHPRFAKENSIVSRLFTASCKCLLFFASAKGLKQGERASRVQTPGERCNQCPL